MHRLSDVYHFILWAMDIAKRTELRPTTHTILPTRRNYKGTSRTDSATVPELENLTILVEDEYATARDLERTLAILEEEGSNPIAIVNCEKHIIINFKEWRSCHDLICIVGKWTSDSFST